MVHAPDCTEYMRGVGRNRYGGNGLARVMDRASAAITPIHADIRASPVPLSGDDDRWVFVAGLLYSATTGGASKREPLPVACHEHGTTLSDFLPASWDHLVASYGTTRRVVRVESSGRLLASHVMFVDVEVNSRGVQGGRRG